MSQNTNAVETIIKYINAAIAEKLESYPKEKTLRMKVTSGLGGGKYNVTFGGQDRIATSLNNVAYNVNDSVWVLVAEGNWSNLLILGR